MEKPDMETIDKLFNCMAEFYGERWTGNFKNGSERSPLISWSSTVISPATPNHPLTIQAQRQKDAQKQLVERLMKSMLKLDTNGQMLTFYVKQLED